LLSNKKVTTFKNAALKVWKGFKQKMRMIINGEKSALACLGGLDIKYLQTNGPQIITVTVDVAKVRA